MDRDRRWERTQRAYERWRWARRKTNRRSAMAQCARDTTGRKRRVRVPTIVGKPRPVERRRRDSVLQLSSRSRASTDDRVRRRHDTDHQNAFDAFAIPSVSQSLFRDDDEVRRELHQPGALRPPPAARYVRRSILATGFHQLRLSRNRKVRPRHVFLQRRPRGPSRRRPHADPIGSHGRDVRSRPGDARARDHRRRYRRNRRGRTSNRHELRQRRHGRPTGKWEPTIESSRSPRRLPAPVGRATLTQTACSRLPPITAMPRRKSTSGNNPLTAHTTNPVPLILIANGLHGTLASDGKLGDVAPTLLTLMGLPIPGQMTGVNLFEASRP